MKPAVITNALIVGLLQCSQNFQLFAWAEPSMEVNDLSNFPELLQHHVNYETFPL